MRAGHLGGRAAGRHGAAMSARPERPGLLALLVALCAITSLSQFHRNVLATVAPEVAADLGAGPEQIGAAQGAFFLAFMVAQIPVGIALDRVGPLRTVGVLTICAVLGALGQALATEPGLFTAARFLLGLGCSASFMSSIVLCARWFGGERLTLALTRITAFSQVGNLVAATPMAAASAWLGWQGAMAGTALLTAVAGLMWWAWVRDEPPDQHRIARPRETLREALLGQVEVWRTPGLLPIVSLYGVAYAVTVTLLGIWAGNYLADVHRLSPEARGMVLSAMVGAALVGQIGIGMVERALDSRKAIGLGGGGISLLCLLLLAGMTMLPGGGPAWLAVLLLGLIGLLSGYSVVVMAQARLLFADHQLGRGSTTVNLAQVLGAAALPAILGQVVGLFAPDAEGARPPAAYAAAFLALAVTLGLGLLGYLPSRDRAPRRGS